MRCREARAKLIQLAGNFESGEEKDALREHLNRCSDCARLVLAERLLTGDLEQLRHVQPSRPMTVEQVREGIAIREQHRKNTSLGVRIMQRAGNTIHRQPRLSLAVAAVLVLLLASVLVPVGTEHQVGYEIAFAAPSSGLVLNQENAEKMLAALDLDDARVRVRTDDSGTEYKIAPLVDPAQVRKLVAVLDSLGGQRVRSTVAPIKSKDRTIWQLLLDEAALEPDASPLAVRAEKRHRDITINLKQMFNDDFVLWMPVGDQMGDSLRGLLLDRQGEKTKIQIVGMPSGSTTNDCGMNWMLNGNTVMNTQMPNGEQVSLDLTNINDVRRLEEAGYNFGLMEFDTPGQIPIPGMGPKLNDIRPNPFAEAATIEFMVPRAYEVRLEILDEHGREISRLLDCITLAGIHQAVWDGRDADGNRVEPGIFLCRFTAGEYVETQEIELER